MDQIRTPAALPQHWHDDTVAALTSVQSAKAFDAWWQNGIAEVLPHDFAVVGRARISQKGVNAADIVMHRGTLRDDPKVLLAQCGSLLTAWNIMKHAALMDLGPCTCIGQYGASPSRERTRRFLIHGKARPDDRVVFAIMTSWHWACEEHAKQLLGSLMGPIADAVERLPACRVLITSRDREEGQPGQVRLTARENEIVGWLCKGRTNKEISRHLGISPIPYATRSPPWLRRWEPGTAPNWR